MLNDDWSFKGLFNWRSKMTGLLYKLFHLQANITDSEGGWPNESQLCLFCSLLPPKKRKSFSKFYKRSHLWSNIFADVDQLVHCVDLEMMLLCNRITKGILLQIPILLVFHPFICSFLFNFYYPYKSLYICPHSSKHIKVYLFYMGNNSRQYFIDLFLISSYEFNRPTIKFMDSYEFYANSIVNSSIHYEDS